MRLSLPAYVSLIARLCKFRISLPVALTAFTGYLAHNGRWSYDAIAPVAGVFLLASAASALNQVQERNTDRRMARTAGRPLPSGKLSLKSAVIWIVLLSISGSLLLAFKAGLMATVLGWLTYVWYNGIYTPLKKKTAFAAVPGGVVGALPPMIGWVASGGSPVSPAALSLALFMFLVQVPHFWLLLLRFGDEYREAGLKSLTERLDTISIHRLTIAWITATAASAIIMPVFFIFRFPLSVWILWLSSAIMAGAFLILLPGSAREGDYRKPFLTINIYVFVVMMTICLDVLL